MLIGGSLIMNSLQTPYVFLYGLIDFSNNFIWKEKEYIQNIRSKKRYEFGFVI